ncbi:MAG: twin-arginine translocase subunit TatC, partial [Bdellovibrionales bacterium]|nr:twin-arginine translocase subunit TatC [Bdellovibrionales bacterium]
MKSMSLTDHLEDLRKMVIRIFIILFVAFFGSYFFGDKISEVLLAPLREVLISEQGAKV